MRGENGGSDVSNGGYKGKNVVVLGLGSVDLYRGQKGGKVGA